MKISYKAIVLYIFMFPVSCIIAQTNFEWLYEPEEYHPQIGISIKNLYQSNFGKNENHLIIKTGPNTSSLFHLINDSLVKVVSYPIIEKGQKSSHYLIKESESGKYAIMDKNGKVKTAFKYDYLEEDFYGIAQIKDNNAIFNVDGKIVFIYLGDHNIYEYPLENIKPTATEILNDKIFGYELNEQWYIVNAFGKSLAGPIVYPSSPGLKSKFFKTNDFTLDKFDVYNVEGSLLMEDFTSQYPLATITNNYIILKGFRKCFLMDAEGKKYLEGKNYKNILETGDRFIAQNDKGKGLLNENLKEAIPCNNHTLYRINDSRYFLFRPSMDYTKAGIYDDNGNILIPPIYNYLWFEDKEYIIAINSSGKYGLLNIENDTLIEFQDKRIWEGRSFPPYKSLSNFIVKSRGDQRELFSKQNELLLDQSFYSFIDLNKHSVAVQKEFAGTLRLFRKDDSKLLNGEYRSIKTTKSDNLFIVSNNNKYGIINHKGKVIVPLEYNFIIPITKELYYVSGSFSNWYTWGVIKLLNT